MTEINQANGRRPAYRPDPFIPAQRDPEDAIPPGVWRGPVPTDQDDSTGPTAPVGPIGPVPGKRATGVGLVRRVVTHPRTRTAPVTVVKGAVRAVTHERTQAAGRTVIRQGAYVLTGAHQTARKRHQARTLHTRMVRAAEVAGDHAAVAQWAERHADYKADRHTRRMALLTMPWHLAKALAVGGGITFAGLITLGVVLGVHERSLHEVISPLMTAISGISWCVHLLELVYGPVLMTLPFAILAALWNAGRVHGSAPAWLMPAGMADTSGAPVTPSILVTALRDLGITELRKKIKDMADVGAAMLSPIRAAGCGIEVDVSLPSGVSTSEIRARREKLAENCGRHRHELFITIPETPRTVRLWIADSGSLDEPIGPSPLVTDPTSKADYTTGRAPWGQSLRGERSTVSVFQRHILITGMSNQGKTAALRALALWLALSVRVKFQIADFKGVGDWGMFEGLAEVLIQGPTDDHVMQGTHMAEAGVAEMQKRTTLMQELAAKGWSHEKILADPRFAPLVLIFDEAQKAYGSGAIGQDKRPYGGTKNTSRYFQAIKAIHDQGRVVNVTTWEGTQDPTNENLPKRTREGNHIRACLVVGTETQSEMGLGENAVAAGAAPHELRQGADKGTLVIAGDVTAFDAPRGQTFTTIRTHFINDEDATAITDRAKALRKGGVQTKDGSAAPAERDLLDDVAAVLGEAVRAQSEEVLHRLKNLDPGHYGPWTTATLKAALEPHGAQARPYGGRQHISRARVMDAIEERDAPAESENGPGEA